MIKIEMTDTFGGESNYSWVERKDDNQSDNLRQAIRRFKRDHGIKARHYVRSDNPDFRSVDLKGACVRIMAWWEY